jgi:hypothetical protein
MRPCVLHRLDVHKHYRRPPKSGLLDENASSIPRENPSDLCRTANRPVGNTANPEKRAEQPFSTAPPAPSNFFANYSASRNVTVTFSCTDTGCSFKYVG